MTFVYRNSNTGQVVEVADRDPCLDMLDNWRIISGPEPADESGPASAGPDRPSEHDNKAAWINYAVSRGMPEADAKSLSKAALIEEFGEANDGED
ncbi:hypothetical protein HNP84_009744 [Thermocatellispora tengchongensis]|uniref:Uncharacterized protein n=1 Tax=Thermocatellispora tengchongensis TaxID=1073253 RepID=A0A840PM03_9ACTN|nr:hypothetical protein [Thermocatellispora tengchongensis]MBB5139979.1 hypothetical protein [Thermocatellispora tengchongensis]